MKHRVAAAVSISTLLFLCLGVSVSAQRVPDGCVERVRELGRWDVIEPPSFSQGSQTLQEYAVDPGESQRIAVTNGIEILLSVDGGCSWSTTLTLDDEITGGSYSSRDSKIVDIETARGIVAVVISQAGHRPHVLLSTYGGQTWRRGDEGLRTTIGTPIQIAYTQGGPQYAYLLIDERVGTDEASASVRQSILESVTAGSSWGSRGSGEPDLLIGLPGSQAVPGGSSRFAGLVADPVEAGRVFPFGPNGLFSYQQGALAPLVTGDIAAAAAVRTPGENQTTLLAAERGSTAIRYSADGGLTFSSLDIGGEADSFAQGLRPGDFFMSAGGAVLRRSAQGLDEISSSGLGAITHLRVAREVRPITPFQASEVVTLYGRSGDSLVRWSEDRRIETPAPQGSVVVGDLSGLHPERLLPGELFPVGRVITLTEGGSKVVPYRLLLPRTPTPLDVFFDVDVSGSMQEEIDGLRAAMASIAQQLATSGIDAWFGVGEYRSFNDPPGFRRLQDINPPDEGLAEALNNMTAVGGGNETQLESLVQIVTGSGSQIGVGIEPDQDATWRPGTLRVVVHITDEPISTGRRHPTYPEVGRILRSDRVIHLGIAVQNKVTELQQGVPYPGLVQISRTSGSVAPPQGIDCDGDGDPELYSGEPLVCLVDPLRSQDAQVMGNAIIDVLRSVSDVGQVLFQGVVNRGPRMGPLPQVTSLPSAISGIDFKQDSQMDVEFRFTCPRLTRSTTFEVEIQARRWAGLLASAPATIRCRALPEEELPLLPPITTLAAVLPPPAPPNTPQQVNSNPNPNPNPAQQSQSQTQAAMSMQEEEQPQVAVATANELEPRTADSAAGRGETYAMSRYATESAPLDAAFLILVAAVVIGVGSSLTFSNTLSPARVSSCSANPRRTRTR